MRYIRSLMFLATVALVSIKAAALTFSALNGDGTEIHYHVIGDSHDVEIVAGNINYEGSVAVPPTVMYEGVAYTVTRTSDSAFGHCGRLESVVLPSTVKELGYNTFISSPKLRHVSLPEGITVIPESTFSGCEGLEGIALPSTVRSVDNMAFNGCSNLRSISLPVSLTAIGYFAFAGCTGLTAIDIPNSVTAIGQYAFSGCTALAHINLSRQLAIIEQDVFAGCTSLSKIEIPASVAYIEPYAFSGCQSLMEIKMENPNPQRISFGKSAFEGVNFKVCTLVVPAGSESKYASTVPWSIFTKVEDE